MSLLPLQNTLPQGVHGLAPTSLCSGVTAGRCLPSPPCPAHPACLSCPHTCCLAPHYHLMYKLINIFTILQFIIHPPPHKKASPKAARWCPLPRTVLAQWASNNALLGHSRGCNGPCILGNELLFTLRSPGGGGWARRRVLYSQRPCPQLAWKFPWSASVTPPPQLTHSPPVTAAHPAAKEPLRQRTPPQAHP